MNKRVTAYNSGYAVPFAYKNPDSQTRRMLSEITASICKLPEASWR